MIDIPSPKLKDSQKAILCSLANNGPCYGYELYRKFFRQSDTSHAGLSDKTIYTELTALQKMGMVGVKESQNKKKSGRKRGRPAKTEYSITLFGLYCTLATTKANSWVPIKAVLSKWGFLIPYVNNLWKIRKEKDFDFEYNLCKSFADMVASIRIGNFSLSMDISEDALLFDLIYHFFQKDLRPPFFGVYLYFWVQSICEKCPDFKGKMELFTKILWLDSKWRTLLFDERKYVFEQPITQGTYLPDFRELSQKARETYEELQNALLEWPLSYGQFLKLKSLHEIWLIKEGEFGLEVSTYS
jgi:hypothetical protein